MKWTEENKSKLIDAASRYKDEATNKINWTLVQTEFPETNKTALKSQYLNNLKQNDTYRSWNTSEKTLLSFCIMCYSTNWSFIQQNYFPKRSKDQVRSKFQQNQEKLELGIQLMKELRTGVYSPKKYELNNVQEIIDSYIVMKKVLLPPKSNHQPCNKFKIIGLPHDDPLIVQLRQIIVQKYDIQQIDEVLVMLNKLRQMML